MDTALQKKLKKQIKKSSLSVRELERKSGLKRSSISNILEGKSKNPSLTTLSAIANTLHCPLSDLIEFYDIETRMHIQLGEDASKDIRDVPLNLPLFHHVIDVVSHHFQAAHVSPTLDQFWTCIRKVYMYTLMNEEREVDSNFVQWVVEQYKLNSLS